MTNRQKEETARFCLDISKLTIGASVLNLFSKTVNYIEIIFSICGLTIAVVFYRLGMKIFEEIT